MKKNLNVEDSFILAEKILQKIALSTIRKIESHFHGDYRSLFQGHGLDFKEIREYSINDDIRSIDWNVTARMGRPHIRVYEEERDHTLWLILDVSSSMDFGSKFVTKKDVMVKFAAVMAYLAYKRGDKTGAILFDNNIKEIISPDKGLKQIYKIVKKLLDYKSRERQDFTIDFSSLSSIIGRKKSLFFISDFILPDSDWKKEFGELGVKNELRAVHILDPAEEAIPAVGYVNLFDPETGRNLVFDSSNPEIIRKYQELLDEENKKLNEIFSVLKLNPVKIYTNSDIADVLINYTHKAS